MADEPVRGRRRTAAPEPPKDPATDVDPGQEQLFGDLSGMAREAVRSPADPRLEAHLAFLGLSDAAAPDQPAGTTAAAESPGVATFGPAPPAAGDRMPGEPGRGSAATDVEQLRAAVAKLQTASTQTADRLRQLTFVIGVLAIATVVALIIGIVR